jgi:hypothetical protein
MELQDAIARQAMQVLEARKIKIRTGSGASPCKSSKIKKKNLPAALLEGFSFTRELNLGKGSAKEW